MSYRKFRADKIFTGCEMLDEKHVLITDEKGKIESIVNENEAGENIESFAGIISPGFVNCHCHLELSHMKNIIPEKTGLVNFVMNILSQRNIPEEKIYEAIEKAEDEMLQNGIVAVGDICNTTHTVLQKKKQKLAYHNFIEVSGLVPHFAQTRFDNAVKIYEEFEILQTEIKNNTSLVPHAPYSVSKELFGLINEFSKGKPSTIHNQESLEEESFFKTGRGEFEKLYKALNIDISFFKPSYKSSLQTFLPWLKSPSSLILVHNTFISKDDFIFISQLSTLYSQLFFCLCPNANFYIENTLPPIDLLRKNNCEIVLGTDSLASNHSLNILSEIKTIKQNFTHIPNEEILEWATLNGAKALQMQNNLGSFEKNKMPGIVCIDESFQTVKRIL